MGGTPSAVRDSRTRAAPIGYPRWRIDTVVPGAREQVQSGIPGVRDTVSRSVPSRALSTSFLGRRHFRHHPPGLRFVKIWGTTRPPPVPTYVVMRKVYSGVLELVLYWCRA